MTTEERRSVSSVAARPEADASVRAEALLSDEAPRWAEVSFEVYCPRCDYNLRGLTIARCPECGLPVDWRRLLESRIRGGDFLFEHAWRRGPFRAWMRTTAAALLPRRFWKRVTLYDPIHVGPLLTQLALTTTLALAGLHLLAWLIVWIAVTFFGARAWRSPRFTRLHPHDPILEQLSLLAEWPRSLDPRYLCLPATILLGFMGAAAVLFTLHQTLERCRVRKLHILRVVVYCAPPVLGAMIVLLLAIAVAVPRSLYVDWQPMLPEALGWNQLAAWQYAVLVAACGGLPAIATACLAIALRDYLHLPRAWIVSALTVLAASLLAYTVPVVTAMFVSGKW